MCKMPAYMGFRIVGIVLFFVLVCRPALMHHGETTPPDRLGQWEFFGWELLSPLKGTLKSLGVY